MAKKTVERFSPVSGQSYIITRSVGKRKYSLPVHKCFDCETAFRFAVNAFLDRILSEKSRNGNTWKVKIILRWEYVYFPKYGVKFIRLWGK
jgi:hypothetical protein